MPTPHPLVAQLVAVREHRRIPRAAIARRVGCSCESVRSWETGKSNPRLSALIAYAQVLGLELALLPAPTRARTATTRNGTR